MSNMYDWVGITVNPLAGRCPHECDYCYVDDMKKVYPNMDEKYSGDIRVDLRTIDKKLNIPEPKTIFLCSCNDLFAVGVTDHEIEMILEKCRLYPQHTYVLQTKNPDRFLHIPIEWYPKKCILGTTIESNRDYYLVSYAPNMTERFIAIRSVGAKMDGWLPDSDIKTMITIEPIMDFDEKQFTKMLLTSGVDFINIGADSKNHRLSEPDPRTLERLIARLKAEGDFEVKIKKNLGRLLQDTL